MRHTVVHTRFRRGVALLMVILIAALAFVGVVAALSFIRPRSATVKGESASDRALSAADGFIDQVLDQINGFGLSYTSEMPPISGPSNADVADAVMVELLEKVNGLASGGVADTVALALARTQTYAVNARTNSIFQLEHGTGTIDTGKFHRITSLAASPDLAYVTGLAGLRSTEAGGDWFVTVIGAQYNMVTDTSVPNPDSWTLTCTAWNTQSPELKRTVQAEAQRGNLKTTTQSGSTDATPWYALVPGLSGETKYFSDYVFLANDDISIAKSSVVTGDVMSNGTLYNGGWIQGTSTAVGRIYNTTTAGAGPGTFGNPAETLTYALKHGIANQYADPATFPNGQSSINAASTGTTGAYHIVATTANTTTNIVFLADGTMTINGGSPIAMPPTNLIYVQGSDVKVHGVVKGRVTIAVDQKSYGSHPTVTSGGDIYIDGNLTYLHDLILIDDPTIPLETEPDALGLLARNNVVLDKTYYESLASHTGPGATRELHVDAAAMAVDGWIGIDPNASTHSSTTTPHYTLIWRGARIFNSFDNAPEVSGGGRTQGFEVKQSYYDWSLQNYKCPPGFPYTSQASTPGRLQQLVESLDPALLEELRHATPTLVLSSDIFFGDGRAYYYYVGSDGTTYYRGQTSVTVPGGTTYTATYKASDFSLYRVKWREAIGTPLQPTD